MAHSSLSRYLLALGSLMAIVLWAWLGRSKLEGWTHAGLAAQHQRQLAQLSEDGAARLIARLAEADDEYLDLIVLSLADPRPAVADAAEQSLEGRMDRWSQWRTDQASSRVAALASLLAESAEQIPPERRACVQRLALQLLTWPVDGTQVDAPQLIADCEALLRLPLPAASEIRIADRPAEVRDAVPLPVEPAPAPAPLPLDMQPEPPPVVDRSPGVPFPREPEPLEGASREKPSEPRQFIAPKAIRISDE
jgi:hypothetical protein